MAGSILKNMVFEIVNSEGDVDETIHDEDKIGQSHLLTIKSDVDGMVESIRYTFKHGRCTVPVIPLPQREGSFCFSACHSRHSNLKLLVKVRIALLKHEAFFFLVTLLPSFGDNCQTPCAGSFGEACNANDYFKIGEWGDSIYSFRWKNIASTGLIFSYASRK